MAYGVIMLYHLHMPSYILRTFTEYPYLFSLKKQKIRGYFNLNINFIFEIASYNV